MKVSRRGFLRSAGGAALALPLLQLPGRAFAQGGAYPKRLVIYYTPNGTKKELWSPSGGTETDFTLGPVLRPLTRHKEHLIGFDGINLTVAGEGPGGPHQRGMASLLTGQVITEGDFVGGDGRRAGWGGGISVDQYLARERQAATSLSSLELGVRVMENVPRGRIIYGGMEQPVPPENNPVSAYQRMFSQMGGVDPETARRMLLRRRSVLDAVLADFKATHKRLTHVDREKLDRHATALRDLERRLSVMIEPPAECSPPAPDSVANVMGEEEFRGLLRAHTDLMVAALACDVTQVASIQCSTAVNALRFTFMDMRNYDGHSLSHAGDGNQTMQTEWERMLVWYADQFAYMLDAMKAVPEGDGTLLDNSLVLWVNEISRGNTHSHVDMPFLIAGGAGGALRTGRWLKYDAVPHNNLLLSVLHAMGLEDESFGDSRFCTGPLTGLM